MIYLDNAATAFPHPWRVIEEQALCMKEYCGNPGRGSHLLAMKAAEKIYECRERVASLFSSKDPQNVIFTLNATMAINTVIKGVLHQGDHVLISDMEHNAVFRPIYKLAREGRISYDLFSAHALDKGDVSDAVIASILEKLRPNTRLLICAHASNICSSVLPLERIGELCRKKGILFAVDAAQSAGHLPIDMERMKIDALCLPGHKGLLGPQGTGILLLGRGIFADTLLEGGSGYNSLEGNMPEEAPERYEAGTLPTPAIAGLCAGLRELEHIGIERIHSHEVALNRCLCRRLMQIPKVTVYAPHLEGSVLLFNAEGISADHMGAMLNERGFCVRTGFHCAALAHASLHTPPTGAVRVSPGIYNTVAHMEAFADAVEELVATNKSF